MLYSYYNPNPIRNNTRDCAIRAVAKALGITWEQSFAEIAAMAFQMGDMMDSNVVWGAVLRMNGFKRDIIPNQCPDCYTVSDFCKDHPKGVFVLGMTNHVATVVNGTLYDSMNTLDEIPLYFWYK